MIKLKNVRPGVLIVADAGLRLAPGQVVEVESLTTQMERGIAEGRLARVDKAEGNGAAPPETGGGRRAEPDDADLSKLPAAEAISRVGSEDDAARLKAHLATEKRRTVIDALKKRLAEVEGGAR